MDVTATLSLGDPLEPARKATAEMLQTRERTYSLPQPFYTDERLFQIDMQEIFHKEWLIAGMTCEIPAKGNYITLQIGKNPIIVVRGAEGKVHAFHNVCRHRGSRLCVSEKGKVAKLVCPYHQWTYELDGRLLFAGTEMGADFDMNQYGLKPVNVKVAGGYIFISLAENPPAIDEFLATLDHYMEPYDMENTKVAVQTTLMEKANWKLVLENNRECYHCNGSHPELLQTLLEWDDTNDPRASQEFKDHVAASAAAWEAEKIPYLHKSHGLRNRIVRMPLHAGHRVDDHGRQAGLPEADGSHQEPGPWLDAHPAPAALVEPLHGRPHDRVHRVADQRPGDHGHHQVAGAQGCRRRCGLQPREHAQGVGRHQRPGPPSGGRESAWDQLHGVPAWPVFEDLRVWCGELH